MYIKENTSSRKLSNKHCIFSNMDHDNLCKVTIVPSQATSLNGTISLSTRTLSTISEQENERDCLFNKNKEKNENGCRNTERSRITSLSCIHQQLVRDTSHSSCQSDKLFHTLCENEKKLHDGINKKINSDSKASSLTNNRYNEISRYLSDQRNSQRLENLLSNDSSIYKCEHCGAINYILGLQPVIEKVKEDRTKDVDDEITTAERDCINNQNKGEIKISINFPDSKNNAQSRIFVDGFKVDSRAKYKDELNEIESLPVKKHTFAMRNCSRNPNGANNIFETEADVKTKHNSHFNNTIKRLFTSSEITKRDKKYDYKSIVRNNNLNKCESSTTMKVDDIDKEEIVRKISYEHKSQIDDMLAADMHSKTVEKIHDSQRPFEKYSDIYPVIDTMKYLARGQFTMLDKQKDELSPKLREKHCTRLENVKKGQSTILYSSRGDYPQRDSGFWLFDEMGHLPEIVLDKYHCLPMPRMDGNRENVQFSANYLQHCNTREKMKNTDNWFNYIEKDSLEDCTLEQKRESDTTTFSSSSAENLIHEWIESLDRKYEINGDISRGRKLVSSKASLDIARHVRVQIADNERSNNAKKSMRELRANDSNIFARLPPKIRKKVYRLIQKLVSSSSAEESVFCHEKCVMTDALKNEKLQHSKSVDASFVHSNEITNNCANDCISTQLSELLKNKNCLFERQNNFVNTRSQDLKNSKDFVKIPCENIAISSDKFGKTILSADNFTRKITRHIVYKNASLKNIVDNNDKRTVTEISTIYRKILENSENMNWDDFQKFIEILHPSQKELWQDICKTINEEAKRIANDANDNIEVCIEISPLVNSENTLKTGEVTKYPRKIVLELDMTLKDVETFFNKKLHQAEKYLDIHKDPDESATMDWNNDERKTISKQTR